MAEQGVTVRLTTPHTLAIAWAINSMGRFVPMTIALCINGPALQISIPCS